MRRLAGTSQQRPWTRAAWMGCLDEAGMSLPSDLTLHPVGRRDGSGRPTMLQGNPRPGTAIAFIHEIRTPLRRTARAFEKALLLRVINPHGTPHPDDQCEIEFQGEHFLVSRRDIRDAADRFGAE
jgi:hypothetical protein